MNAELLKTLKTYVCGLAEALSFLSSLTERSLREKPKAWRPKGAATRGMREARHPSVSPRKR